MNADFLAQLQKAGLTRAEAKSTAAKFDGWGYDLTREYSGDGNHLLQSDDALDFLVRRLLIAYTPAKRLGQGALYQIFRSLSYDGWRIVLPRKHPIVP